MGLRQRIMLLLWTIDWLHMNVSELVLFSFEIEEASGDKDG